MVLDNTGSMNWNVPGDTISKMDVLQDSAKDLVNIIHSSIKGKEANFQGDSLLKIGLVPFSATVNVGQDKADAFWIRNQNLQYAPNGEGQPVDDLFQALKTEWYGCVEARSNGYDLDDKPPSPSDEDTLWHKYFYPDEPDFLTNTSITGSRVCKGNKNEDRHTYYNNYLYDFGKGTLSCYNKNYEDRLFRDEKYNYDNRVNIESWQSDSSKNFNSPSKTGPNYLCNGSITALTDNKDEILSALDDMSPRGYTIISLGLVWGWRVLSPGEPFTQGKDYNDNVRKILILLTDGYNSIGYYNKHIYKGIYTAYGFTSERRFQSDQNTITLNEDRIKESLDEKTRTVCDNIKQASQKEGGTGIEIFSISFGFSNDSNRTRETKELLENCASSEDNYFDAKDSDALKSAFRNIANKLSKARISK